MCIVILFALFKHGTQPSLQYFKSSYVQPGYEGDGLGPEGIEVVTVEGSEFFV